MKPIFSIIVPVYQNEENLPDTVPRLLALRDLLDRYQLELVFVEDGSSDKSYQVLKEYASRYSDAIKVVKLTRNFGQNPAIQAGLHHALGKCVGIISADLQEPCEMFVDMIRKWEGGAKFVIGERVGRDEGFWHRLVKSPYWFLTRRFAIRHFPKQGFDFCLVDRQIVNELNGINEKNTAVFTLMYWLGYHPASVPIVRQVRMKGRSQWTWVKQIKHVVDTLIGFTYLPSRIITGMGFVTAVFCPLYFVVMVVVWYRLRLAPPGWMTVVGLLVLIGSMILFALGIISEYLLRILDEARKRPLFVVDHVLDTHLPRESLSVEKASY